MITIFETLLPPNPLLSGKETPDIVCPKCHKPLVHHCVYGPGQDEYCRTLRSYYGFCNHCAASCEVLQFEAVEQDKTVWKINRYRVDLQKPVVVQLLPEPAPVITGPGGDFVHAVSEEALKQQANKTISTLTEVVIKACAGIKESRAILNMLCSKKS